MANSRRWQQLCHASGFCKDDTRLTHLFHGALGVARLHVDTANRVLEDPDTEISPPRIERGGADAVVRRETAEKQLVDAQIPDYGFQIASVGAEGLEPGIG